MKISIGSVTTSQLESALKSKLLGDYEKQAGMKFKASTKTKKKAHQKKMNEIAARIRKLDK